MEDNSVIVFPTVFPAYNRTVNTDINPGIFPEYGYIPDCFFFNIIFYRYEPVPLESTQSLSPIFKWIAKGMHQCCGSGEFDSDPEYPQFKRRIRFLKIQKIEHFDFDFPPKKSDLHIWNILFWRF